MVGGILTFGVWICSVATAGPPKKTPSANTHYQGAFWSVQAQVGIVAGGGASSTGPALGASFRIASILSLADVELGVLAARYALPDAGTDLEVERMSIGLTAHVHPLFLLMLRNTRFWYWVAGLHISLGVDLELTGTGRGSEADLQVDAGWRLGAGTDIPLTDPKRGWSLWLSVDYRYRFLTVESPHTARTNFNEHVVLFTLGYRNNNIFGVRVPIPTEFDYRNPPGRE